MESRGFEWTHPLWFIEEVKVSLYGSFSYITKKKDPVKVRGVS